MSSFDEWKKRQNHLVFESDRQNRIEREHSQNLANQKINLTRELAEKKENQDLAIMQSKERGLVDSARIKTQGNLEHQQTQAVIDYTLNEQGQRHYLERQKVESKSLFWREWRQQRSEEKKVLIKAKSEVERTRLITTADVQKTNSVRHDSC